MAGRLLGLPMSYFAKRRTGDIERTLTVGVHGPGELHVVIVP